MISGFGPFGPLGLEVQVFGFGLWLQLSRSKTLGPEIRMTTRQD